MMLFYHVWYTISSETVRFEKKVVNEREQKTRRTINERAALGGKVPG